MVTVPNLLSIFRLLLVPVLLLLAFEGRSKAFFILFLASLLSDAVDGFLARRLHQASALGAKLDSWADFVTYLTLPFCGWWLRPEIVRQERWWLAAGISCYLAATVVGFMKFKRLTSYHSWAAKFSAVVMGLAVVVFFAGGPGWVFRIVMPIVVVTNLEEIAITLSLPQLQSNVPSLWHARKLRRSNWK